MGLLKVIGLISLALLTGSTIHDVGASDCPQVPQCTCKEVAPSFGTPRQKVIDCSDRSLENIPQFQSLISQTYDALWLGNNKISRLTNGAFSGINVKMIDLSNNPIQSMSNNAFKRLDFLEELIIRNAHLTSVPTGMKVLENLRKLDLHNNKIVSLPGLETLTKLRHLDLSNNKIQITASDHSFDNIHHLEYLNLGGNRFTNVPSEILSHTPNITTLILRDNRIEGFLEGIFQKMPKLVTLDLKNNPIRIPKSKSVFQGLTKLRHMSLGGCTLDKLQPITFQDMRQLRNLTVHSCGVKSIEPGFFNDFRYIEHLDIGGNTFTLTTDILEGTFETVRTLNLDGLNLDKIPKDILSMFPLLTDISLNGNQIQSIPARAFEGVRQPRVKILLEDNRIATVSSSALDGSPTDLDLDISGNLIEDITFLNENPCKFARGSIDLTANPIRCDCGTFKMAQRKSLELSGACASPAMYKGLILKWHKGLVPEEDYLERNNKTVDECLEVDRSQERYDCSCRGWIDWDAPVACSVIGIATHVYCTPFVMLSLVFFSFIYSEQWKA